MLCRFGSSKIIYTILSVCNFLNPKGKIAQTDVLIKTEREASEAHNITSGGITSFVSRGAVNTHKPLSDNQPESQAEHSNPALYLFHPDEERTGRVNARDTLW